MTLKRKIILILLVALLGVIFAASAVVTYAYFSKKEIYDGYLSGQVELLFDRLNDEGVAAYDPVLKAEFGNDVAASKDADWGTKEYPFVISNVRHLYNLSELQRLGYFDKKFIAKNRDAQGNYTTYTNIPYFLVCTPAYKPALIDGTNFRGITAIGTDKYPFIGSVKGVTNTNALLSGKTAVNGKTCDTSTISNVKVTGNPQNVDVGLFGVIGYLGTVPQATTDNPNPTFEGQISTVSNLVISDIQIIVDDSKWDKLQDFLAAIITGNHEFSFSVLKDTEDYNKVPHENHHIGILAGHASYAKIEYISVYYSSDDIVAINLSDTTTTTSGTAANYFSSTGILGYINNINPKIEIDQQTGKVTITAGSGDSTSGLNYGMVGGGGTSSGTQAGYVLAGKMYEKFHWTGNPPAADTSGTIKIKDALDENGNSLCTEWVRDRILWGTEKTGRYYFYDGVFTFALSSTEDIIEPTWEDVTYDENGNPVTDENGKILGISDFSIGQNDDSKWKKNTQKGNNSVVAYVKDIANETELQAAINAGKQIYIGYETTTNINLMSLATNNSTEEVMNFEDFITTPAFTNTFITGSGVSDIQVTLQYAQANGETIEGMLPRKNDNSVNTDIINNITDYRLINLGTAENLVDIKNNYPINATGSEGSYTFKGSISECYLALLRTTGLSSAKYSFFTGKTVPNGWGYVRASWVTVSTVSFNNDGTVYIRYDYTSENAYRYVRYENKEFKGTTNQNATGTKLRFYVVEGTSNLNFGRITFDPIDDTSSTTDSYTFSAGTHVLFANPTHTRENGTTGNITATTTGYTVTALADLKDKNGTPWNNGVGSPLSQADLLKKFKMVKGITFGASFDIFNGSLSTSGIITAPVGTDGVSANIPMACVAFKINKPIEAAKIRVIVSVAVSEFYPGEKENNVEVYELGNYTRYFNLWKMQAAGESIVQIFNATGSNLLDRIEIPRSHPYEPGTTVADTENRPEYIMVNYGGSQYRCYLNGDRVLIAYEFTVNTMPTNEGGTGTGVYCLGMSGLDANNNVVGDVPMEIVYFSADGVASSGRDGASGSQIGTIDFVYDYSNTIVTVKDSSTTDENGKEDYSTYYPSYCLLYFDNSQHADGYTEEAPKFIPVQTEVLKVRRYVGDTTGEPPGSDEKHNDTKSYSVITFKVDEGDGHIRIVQYSLVADNVQERVTPTGGGTA